MRFMIPLTCTVFLASPAFAVGSNDSSPPVKTETTTTCEDGQIFDDKTKACVDADKQSFNDDDRYRAVRELAYAGEYQRALRVISMADNPKSSRFLTYRGFIHRQNGKMDQAMAFYTAALRADPDNVLARSYMGMGLAKMGHKGAAQAQLEEIAARSGQDGWAFTALKAVLDGEAGAIY